MSKQKLAPAKEWRNRDIKDWNVISFTEYLKDSHKHTFGVDYAPMRSWGLEQGMIGDLIGTKTKERTVSNALVKAFIDEAFATYTPNASYPGTSFGFSYSYRRNILQRLQAEEMKQEQRKVSEDNADSLDDLADWL